MVVPLEPIGVSWLPGHWERSGPVFFGPGQPHASSVDQVSAAHVAAPPEPTEAEVAAPPVPEPPLPTLGPLPLLVTPPTAPAPPAPAAAPDAFAAFVSSPLDEQPLTATNDDTRKQSDALRGHRARVAHRVGAGVSQRIVV
jgi:hypothetical protein